MRVCECLTNSNNALCVCVENQSNRRQYTKQNRAEQPTVLSKITPYYCNSSSPKVGWQLIIVPHEYINYFEMYILNHIYVCRYVRFVRTFELDDFFVTLRGKLCSKEKSIATDVDICSYLFFVQLPSQPLYQSPHTISIFSK